MTRTRACGELRSELGVYLLGAMAPADRSAVESHLASCTGCRDELADLAGLPALLRRIPLDEVERLVSSGEADRSIAVPERSVASLLKKVARFRRYRVWTEVALAITMVLGAGAVAAYGAFSIASPHPAPMAMPGAITVHGSNPHDDASAVVRYAGRPWGVQLYVQVNGIAAGTTCVLEVTESSGRELAAGSWTITAGAGDSWYGESVSLPVTDVRGFVVTTGSRALVRVVVPGHGS